MTAVDVVIALRVSAEGVPQEDLKACIGIWLEHHLKANPITTENDQGVYVPLGVSVHWVAAHKAASAQ